MNLYTWSDSEQGVLHIHRSFKVFEWIDLINWQEGLSFEKTRIGCCAVTCSGTCVIFLCTVCEKTREYTITCRLGSSRCFLVSQVKISLRGCHFQIIERLEKYNTSSIHYPQKHVPGNIPKIENHWKHEFLAEKILWHYYYYLTKL